MGFAKMLPMQLTALILICSIAIFAQNSLADEITDQFDSNGVIGTLVIASGNGTPIYVHGNTRADTRYSPASTFKILNTLIAMESGVVNGKDTAFKWDHVDRGSDAWNRDHTLQTAFKASCVWVFQEIARRVGAERYISKLQALGYGNSRVGDKIDQFWLNDELKISAMEQIEFLSNLTNQALPFNAAHFAELRSIMLVEETPSYSLYAKSGWTGAALKIGWYVGYVESNDEVILFAMNMDMDKIDQAPLRKQLVLAALRDLELI